MFDLMTLNMFHVLNYCILWYNFHKA